jgi:hypothetical protein
MLKTETETARAVDLELPPSGGNLSVILEEDAHYLKVTLDKSENFKVAAGERLRDLLVNKFANNRNALRDWYEETVVQGKAHRAWKTVEVYMSVVSKYGESAADVFAEREQRNRDEARERLTRHREEARAYRDAQAASYDHRAFRDKFVGAGNFNEISAQEPINTRSRPVKTSYEQRREWLSDMNVLWFKGDPEWQDRWLKDRRLLRERKF